MGEGLEIVYFSDDCAEIEETRKNGQEDTHMKGMAVLENGVWRWENEDYNSFVMYHSEKFSNAILEYLTVNGLPKE